MSRFATTTRKNRRGSSLAMAIVLTSAVVAVALAILELTETNFLESSRRVNAAAAYRIAEAGIEKAVWCLNSPSVSGSTCPGNPNGYIGESNVTFGGGKFTVSVPTSIGNSRTVTSTGAISGSGGSTTQQVRAQISATGTDVSFNYGLLTGIGGLELFNTSYISGNVYSSGDITGHQSSHIDGDVIMTLGNPSVDVSSDPAPGGSAALWGSANGTLTIAQSFKPNVTEKLFSIDLKVAKTCASCSLANATIFLYSDNGSDRPGSDLTGGGQAFTATLLQDPSGLDGWTTQAFTPSTNPILIAGTKYWLVLQTASSGAEYRKVLSSGANGDGLYAAGTALVGNSPSSLSALCTGGCDIAFRTNMGGVYAKLDGMDINKDSDGNGGNAFAYRMTDSAIASHACYTTLNGTSQVKANGGSETCSDSGGYVLDCSGSTFPSGGAPYCHKTDPQYIPPQVDFPLSDAQIGALETQTAASEYTCASSSYTIPSGTIGPLKITCDEVIIDSNVTLTGSLWINGNLTISGGTTVVQLDSAFGTNDGFIIVDRPSDRVNFGSIWLKNTPVIQPGSTSSYIMLLAMNTNMSGAPNARGYTDAINVDEGPTGNFTLYAANGGVDVNQSASFKEVTGQKITLKQSAHITYASGLMSSHFTSGPGASWVMNKGTYQVL